MNRNNENATASTDAAADISEAAETDPLNREIGTLEEIDEKYFILKSENGYLFRIDISYLPKAVAGDRLVIVYKDKTLVEQNTYTVKPSTIYPLLKEIRPVPKN